MSKSGQRKQALREQHEHKGKSSQSKTTYQKTAHHPAAHKERGGLLSTLLVLIAVHAAFAVYLVWITMKQEYASSASWILPSLILNSLAVIVAAVGMWYWKKWGLYLYLITQIIATVVHLILTGQILVVFYDIVPVAILGYVINWQKKLKYFE